MSLYKYLIPDRIDVLQNRTIRFTQHMALNDPFEMKPFFELLAEDTIMKQLFLFGGEETWNAGFDQGYSLISKVFDQMKKHFPNEESQREIDKIGVTFLNINLSRNKRSRNVQYFWMGLLT